LQDENIINENENVGIYEIAKPVELECMVWYDISGLDSQPLAEDIWVDPSL
jgi:hypothetical protein